MSAIVIDNGLVHYEVIGRGKPVIFLHGWMGSWRYWMSTMEAISRGFRCYALDFWGFGDSDKSHHDCTLTDYLALVDKFMDRMGLIDAPVVGHSMGGAIAMRLNLEYPHRVNRLVLVSAPVNGKSVTPIFKSASNPMLSRLLRSGPASTFYKPLLQRWIATNWQVWYNEILEDMDKVTPEASRQSMDSLVNTDLTADLHRITVPVLAVHGDDDEVVNPNQLKFFQQGNSNGPRHARAEMFPKSRHFPMLDSPSEFNRLLLDTLNELPATPPPVATTVVARHWLPLATPVRAAPRCVAGRRE